jgi:hypothetical protein
MTNRRCLRSRPLASIACVLRSIRFALIVTLLAGCASQSPVKSVEVLDERTGMTMGALLQPMAFIETGIYDLLVPDKQPSIVYIGLCGVGS